MKFIGTMALFSYQCLGENVAILLSITTWESLKLKHLASWVRLPEVGDSQPPFLKTKKKSERDSMPFPVLTVESHINNYTEYATSVKADLECYWKRCQHSCFAWQKIDAQKNPVFEKNNPSWLCLGPWWCSRRQGGQYVHIHFSSKWGSFTRGANTLRSRYQGMKSRESKL